MMERIMNYKLLPLYPRNSKVYNTEAELLYNGVLDENVKNIGIIAHYGAGKSSLLKTFKDNYSNKETDLKFLNISLASFNSEHKSQKPINGKPVDGGVQDLNNDVEKSILQQMLYKKEKNDLPKSQIKRNNNFIGSKYILYFFLIVVAAVCVASFLLYALNFNNIEILKFDHWDVAYLILGVCTFLIFIVLLLFAINISKISIKGIELELKGQGESLLNKFLDEIIYFFQRTKYNVVIFEDLDRFDNLNIFSKLRELNNILNSNEVILAQKKITFIYAVKDQMFDNSNDRAKFFDLILPVFSVLSQLNVRSQIVNALKESNLGADWLTKSFIHDISIYIKDMRILNSIINDCVTICSETDLSRMHGDKEIDKHIQIFSLMTYKNLFPKDFALLEEDKGDFKSFMEKADELRKNNIKANLAQISRLEESNKTYKNYIRDTGNKSAYGTNIKQNQEQLDELYHKNKLWAGVIAFTCDNLETVFKPFLVDNTLKPEYKLLKMLIRYGYIKDNFKNYIYKMDANFLAENDDKYIRILINREPPEFYLKLNDINIILEDLSDDKLSSESALNFDITNYLFENDNDKNHSKLLVYKNILIQNTPLVNQFIVEYILTENEWNKDFIKFLITNKENTLSLVLNSKLPETKIDKCFNYILTNFDASDIAIQNDLNEFVSYILDSDGVLSNVKNYVNKLAFLKSKGFEIRNLEQLEISDEVLNSIVQNNAWEVNYLNISMLLKRLYNYSQEQIDMGGISLIRAIPNTHLSNYILSDMRQYLEKVMLISNSFNLNASDFRSIITNYALPFELRKRVIENQETAIDYFANVQDDTLQCLFENNKVIASINQLSTLSAKSILKDSIIKYLILNIPKFSDKPITSQNLTLYIVNTNILVEDKTLTEIYFNSIQNNLPKIQEITNDASMSFILKNKNLNLTLDDINYISNNDFSKSQVVLATKYMSSILDVNFENNLIVRLALKHNEDKEVRRRILCGNILEITDEDDLVVVKPIVDDIISNKFEITSNIYYSLNKKALCNADRINLLLSQVDYLSKDTLLDYVKNLGGIYFKLINTGELYCDDDSLYKDPIILALESKALIKKRKKSNKYCIKLYRPNVLMVG